MDAKPDDEPTLPIHRTTVVRTSACELEAARTFDAPARRVFEAWTSPALLMRWWAPKSSGVSLIACEADVRVGGRYRFAFGQDTTEAMVFFGRYVDVVPHARLVWTNEESAAGALTTVAFQESGPRTQLTLHERYPSNGALDDAVIGMESAFAEQFEQLDALLLALGTSVDEA